METKKRIYIGLLGITLCLMVGLAVLGWYLVSHRHFPLSRIFLFMLIIVGGILFLFLGLGILAIVIMIIRSKTIPSLEMITQWANDLLFPLALLTGKLFGIEREKILKSYISVNNYLVKNKNLHLPAGEILILLPHCLQNTDCQFKITIDVNNCKDCGKCKISALKELADKYHVRIRVATGGTLARKWIKEHRPKAVIAVACERDLSSGIQDAGDLPVMGVLNMRPNGPCINTDVDVEEIDRVLHNMCLGGE